MKMIIAIVNSDDAADVGSALTREHFRYTKVSSTGGFLKTGNTTLLIGTRGYHAMITWLSCTDHVADHALIP